MSRKANPPYRVGIVGAKGAGGIGGEHTRAAKLHPKTQVVAICDINPAGFDAYQERYGPVVTYTHHEAMLAEQEIDLLCVGTSDHAHCEIVETACRAGVPMLFCEKPLDVTLDRGDRMARAVEESRATFLCDHTRRWMPTWVKAKQILDERVGPVVRARAHMGSPRAMLYRNGTHLIDALCWFVGDEPAWLVGGELEDLGVFDPNPACTALLGFRQGCRAFIDMSKRNPDDLEIDCVGEEGRLTVNGGGVHLAREEAGLGLTYTHVPSASDDSEGMAYAIRDLIAAYEENRATRSTASEALRALEVITAIIRSHDRTGGRIEWPLDRTAVTPSEGKLGLDARTLEWQRTAC
jgi:predicted dehydrogenase